MERDSSGARPAGDERIPERWLALCARPGICRDKAVAAGRAGVGRVAPNHEERVAGLAAHVAQYRPRCAEHRSRSARRRNRRMPADSSIQPSRILIGRFASKMTWPIQNRRNGSLRPGWRWGPSFWKRGAQPKRRRYIGKSCGEIVTTGGALRSIAGAACATRMSRRRLSKQRFKKAWARADVDLNASRFGCIPPANR